MLTPFKVILLFQQVNANSLLNHIDFNLSLKLNSFGFNKLTTHYIIILCIERKIGESCDSNTICPATNALCDSTTSKCKCTDNTKALPDNSFCITSTFKYLGETCTTDAGSYLLFFSRTFFSCQFTKKRQKNSKFVSMLVQ